MQLLVRTIKMSTSRNYKCGIYWQHAINRMQSTIIYDSVPMTMTKSIVAPINNVEQNTREAILVRRRKRTGRKCNEILRGESNYVWHRIAGSAGWERGIMQILCSLLLGKYIYSRGAWFGFAQVRGIDWSRASLLHKPVLF